MNKNQKKIMKVKNPFKMRMNIKVVKIKMKIFSKYHKR